MSTDLVPTTASVTRTPEAVITEAAHAAGVLKQLVVKNGWSKRIGNSDHLFVEAWVTAGKFNGYTVRTLEPEYVEMGGHVGFKAAAEVLDKNGNVIGGGFAFCMNDEEKWKDRPKYETVNGQRKRVGVEPVPLFQLASMAQTRASAKALRNLLGWFVVLAGFKATPAEEMDGIEGGDEKGDKKDVFPSSGERVLVIAKTGISKQGEYKQGSRKGQTWTSYFVDVREGPRLYTYSETVAADASSLVEKPATVAWDKDDKGYFRVLSISPLADEGPRDPGQEG